VTYALHHSLWDFFLIGTIYKATTYIDPLITPEHISLPSPVAYSFARFALWSLYGFATGLIGTGLWDVGHECGHQAFSESKFINNLVGWILHTGSVQFRFPVDLSRVGSGVNRAFLLSVSEFLTFPGV